MLGLIANLFLMGILLLGIIKAYAETPFLNQNPILSSVGGLMVIVILLWIFPKLIGFAIKFAVFSCVVFFICQATGISVETFIKSSAQKKINQVSDTTNSVSEALDTIQDTADSVKNLVVPTETVTARVENVQSGHTMTFNNEAIQLYGIDTPDLGQQCKTRGGNSYSCGIQSQAELQSFIQNKDVQCQLKGKNKNGRRVATCTVDGNDLAALMVRNGWAVADKAQTNKYEEEEKSAYLRKSGMWNGKFQAPWDWRQKHQTTEKQTENKNKNKNQSVFQKVMGFFDK